MATAAAVLLVIGAAMVWRSTGAQEPAELVAASASITEAAGAAEVELDAEAEVAVLVAEEDGAPVGPVLGGVPVELHAHLEARWQAALEQLEAEMERFEAELRGFEAELEGMLRDTQRGFDEAARDMQRQLEDLADAFGGDPGAPSPERDDPPRDDAAAPVPPRPLERGEPPRAPEPPRPPVPPRETSAGFHVRGRGAVDFAGDRLWLDGTVAAGAGGGTPFRIAVDADGAAYAGPDGSWVGLPSTAGPLAALVLEPEAVVRVLRGARGEVTAAGRGEVDGIAVRRYRFVVDGRALAEAGTRAAEADWTAEAWIDDEGRARRLELTTEGLADAETGTRWRARVGLRLSAFGARVDAPAPPAPTRHLPPLAPASRLVYPFGPNLAALPPGAD